LFDTRHAQVHIVLKSVHLARGALGDEFGFFHFAGELLNGALQYHQALHDITAFGRARHAGFRLTTQAGNLSLDSGQPPGEFAGALRLRGTCEQDDRNRRGA
jgi:hypothetical protein